MTTTGEYHAVSGPDAAPGRVRPEGGVIPARDHASRSWRSPLTLAALAAMLVASIILAVTIGPTSLPVTDVWGAIVAHLGWGTSPLPMLRDAVVWDIRLPRVLTAAAVGAALAMSGAVMQALTRNQLADPYLLGLSAGASVGAVAVLLLGISLLLPVAAFAGAAAALVLTVALARSLGAMTPSRLILAGITISAFAMALTSLLVFWNVAGDSYREILNWLLGSVAGADLTTVWVSWAAVIAIGIPLACGAQVLDAFVFGDESAAALGVNVPVARWLLLGATALLTGVAVAVAGAIGFVGLVLPNAVRLVAGLGHRMVVPLCALAGAVFMIWVDTGARTLFAPRELPVGIITAMIGAPVFALVLIKHRGAS